MSDCATARRSASKALRAAAQVIFRPDGMVKPFDIGIILAEYL